MSKWVISVILGAPAHVRCSPQSDRKSDIRALSRWAISRPAKLDGVPFGAALCPKSALDIPVRSTHQLPCLTQQLCDVPFGAETRGRVDKKKARLRLFRRSGRPAHGGQTAELRSGAADRGQHPPSCRRCSAEVDYGPRFFFSILRRNHSIKRSTGVVLLAALTIISSKARSKSSSASAFNRYPLLTIRVWTSTSVVRLLPSAKP